MWGREWERSLHCGVRPVSNASCHPPEKLRRGVPAPAIFSWRVLRGKIQRAKSPAGSQVPFPTLRQSLSLYIELGINY